MQEFDPRGLSFRIAPQVIAGAAALIALFAAWKLTDTTSAPQAPPLAPEAVAALQHAAFTGAGTQPGYARPHNVRVKLLPGETLEDAVARVGVAPAEAQQAVQALG